MSEIDHVDCICMVHKALSNFSELCCHTILALDDDRTGISVSCTSIFTKPNFEWTRCFSPLLLIFLDFLFTFFPIDISRPLEFFVRVLILVL